MSLEREIILTGIGGQGVQLAATVLARAATREDRHVMTLGTYGGTMRGGNTDATVVVGEGPITTPPIVSRTWAAIALHHQFWAPVRAKLRAGGVLVIDPALFQGELDGLDVRVFEIPARRIASELGAGLATSMVLVGAFARLSALVAVDSLVEAMKESVPSYRTQHLAANEAALRAGFDAAPADAARAFEGSP